jgi:hypothetical protein
MSDNNDHGAPGKSLITEVERLREAVLRLCDVVKEIDIKVENQSELLEGLGKIVGSVIDVLPLKTDKPITDGDA